MCVSGRLLRQRQGGELWVRLEKMRAGGHLDNGTVDVRMEKRRWIWELSRAGTCRFGDWMTFIAACQRARPGNWVVPSPEKGGEDLGCTEGPWRPARFEAGYPDIGSVEPKPSLFCC